jgi:hemolysin activation/secretion protein
MDQTPLPFEFNTGKTYTKIESKTVWVKEQRSRWNKRQVTLQLTLYADGLPYTKPLLMFRGLKKLNTKAHKDEVARYPQGIYVIFNLKAYANGKNLKQ